MRIVIVSPQEWEVLWMKLMPQQRLLPVSNTLHIPSINALVVVDENLRISKNTLDAESFLLTKFTESVRTGGGTSIYRSAPAPDESE
jgi:hypothetical protein